MTTAPDPNGRAGTTGSLRPEARCGELAIAADGSLAEPETSLELSRGGGQFDSDRRGAGTAEDWSNVPQPPNREWLAAPLPDGV